MTTPSPSPKTAQPSPYNLPNAITVVRILMVPVFVWLVLKNPNPNSMQAWWATGVFVLANVTDGLDGAIARSRGLVTNLGKILDPIADKALIGAGLILLSMLNVVPWVATILILVRELGITVYRLIVVRKRVVAASSGGKLKTILQAVTISFMLSPLDSWWAPIGVLEQVLLWVSVALTLYSGAQYVLAAIKAPRV
jgi:CDP-diacylglycerol--glycerol-3-phosphate 3-phosphatidyltransferase